MSIKGKKPKNIKNDWNLSNDEKKEVNINLYTKKKKQKLSKERIQPFIIKGKDKNRNYIPKNEINIFIKGEEKNENPEGVIINDDYNQLQRKYNKLHANIKKVYEISDESSSEFDILKDLRMYNEQNNEYKELIINSLNNAGKEKQKVIINEIKGIFPNGIEIYEGKKGKKEKNKYQNIIFNNILNQDININENLYSKKKVIQYSKKNISQTEPRAILKTDLNINLQENAPETKVEYREMISTEKIDINNQNEQNQQNHNVNSDKDENNKDYPTSDINSQKSQTKYSYREQIISLSPNRDDKQEDILSNNFSYQSFKQIGFNDNQNDFFSNTNSNSSLNNTDKKTNNMQNKDIDSPFKNNIDNEPNYPFIDNSEQVIPRIQDEEPNIVNNYTQQINEKSPKKQQQIQYIFKKENQPKSKEDNLNDNNEHIIKKAKIKKISRIEKIDKSKYYNNNNNNKYYNKIYNNNINYNNNTDNNYNINYNNNYPEQEQSNIITQKKFIQKTIISENQDNDNINQINGIDNINFNNSEIINRNYLENINTLNNLNKNINFQQQLQIDISKSQEFPILFKQSQTQGQRNQKYDNFIQGYSKHLMTNPSDNFNNFSLNKLNIMPVSAGQYGNVILNNTSSTSQNYYMKQRESRESHDNNINITNSNSDMKNNIDFSFGGNYDFNKNTKKKVKLLKA